MKRLIALLLALLFALTGCIVVQIDAPQATEQITNAPEETRNQLPIVEIEPCCTIDPYTSVDKTQFYANYTPACCYQNDGNTYCVLDANGNVVNRIFKNGGYVTLEEVAAYVYAFGDIPANYTSKKTASPSSNPWGEYLRLNHTSFSGSTSKIPL